ncbi:unnamed protein product [Diamesa hyperborea]
MGKGFNNYMSKKFFHPASRDNLKRVWMAEQQAEAYKKKQEELRTQYEKEQDLHENKAMLSKESKAKLSVNFIYEPPPGIKKEREKEDNEPEYKFEWQRKYNAPRESYCKGDTEIRDQPFGIQVRNVRCIKCHKFGHINTDKECSMFGLSMSEAKKIHSEQEASQLMSKGGIEDQLKDDGLAMKKNALSLYSQQHGRLHQLVADEEETERKPETEFLRGLTKQQKKDLLKKLEKIDKRHQRKKMKKDKKSKDSSKHKKRNHKKRSDTSSDSSEDEKQTKTPKRKEKRNDSSDDNEHHNNRHDKRSRRDERDDKNDRNDRDGGRDDRNGGRDDRNGGRDDRDDRDGGRDRRDRNNRRSRSRSRTPKSDKRRY